MRREFIATTEDGEVSITVEPRDDARDDGRDEHQWQVTIHDRTVAVDARQVRPGTWSLLVEGRSYVIDLDAGKRGLAILAGTSEVTIELEDARKKRLARAVRGDAAQQRGEIIRAPIAGKVVKVLVKAGDSVGSGHNVAVLEAMKMENNIKAERGGVVDTVHVSADQSVETGEPLVTLG